MRRLGVTLIALLLTALWVLPSWAQSASEFYPPPVAPATESPKPPEDLPCQDDVDGDGDIDGDADGDGDVDGDDAAADSDGDAATVDPCGGVGSQQIDPTPIPTTPVSPSTVTPTAPVDPGTPPATTPPLADTGNGGDVLGTAETGIDAQTGVGLFGALLVLGVSLLAAPRLRRGTPTA